MSNTYCELLGIHKSPNIDQAVREIERQIVSEIYLAGENIIDAAMSFNTGLIRSIYREGQNLLEPAERLTLCILVFESGFIMTGESIVKDSSDFNVDKGREYARANAIQKILA
jgi:hypothetical protein